MAHSKAQGGIFSTVKQTSLMRKGTLDEEKTTGGLIMRIVLLGKTGVGKSAAGNTILRQKEFTSVMRLSSVTGECSAAQATVSGRSVSVVDTPGLIDTQMNPEELMMEIARSVYISSPGPHAFLIVLRADDRFTEHEQQIPQQIEKMFGEEVLKYSIILFTHGDLLKGKTLEKLIEENSGLRSLVQRCGGRYHVFNNRDEDNREQVEDLLQKIDSMIQQNGGGHYSNEIYKDAHRFRQEEEEEERLREEERLTEVEMRVKEEVKRWSEEERKLSEEEKEKRKLRFVISHRNEIVSAKMEPRTGFQAFFSRYENCTKSCSCNYCCIC